MKNKTKEAEQKITQIKVGVFRRLDNRFENLGDDSPRALELHNRRKEALHEVFDGRKSVEVIDWGQTDDAQPHEFVEIVVGALAVKVFQPGLKFLGQKLAEKACRSRGTFLGSSTWADGREIGLSDSLWKHAQMKLL
jgi:hypothetical protein